MALEAWELASAFDEDVVSGSCALEVVEEIFVSHAGLGLPSISFFGWVEFMVGDFNILKVQICGDNSLQCWCSCVLRVSARQSERSIVFWLVTGGKMTAPHAPRYFSLPRLAKAKTLDDVF